APFPPGSSCHARAAGTGRTETDRRSVRRERARETDPRSEARNGSRGRRQVLRHVRRGKVGARDRAKVETAPDRVRVLRREYRAGDADLAQLEAEGMTPAKERRWRRETDREFAVWERQMAAAWSGRRIPPIDELDERERAVTGPSPATGATIGDETGRSERRLRPGSGAVTTVTGVARTMAPFPLDTFCPYRPKARSAWPGLASCGLDPTAGECSNTVHDARDHRMASSADVWCLARTWPAHSDERRSRCPLRPRSDAAGTHAGERDAEAPDRYSPSEVSRTDADHAGSVPNSGCGCVASHVAPRTGSRSAGDRVEVAQGRLPALLAATVSARSEEGATGPRYGQVDQRNGCEESPLGRGA